MSVFISKNRTKTIPYEDKENGISFSVTFRFPLMEEINSKRMAAKVAEDGDAGILGEMHQIFKSALIGCKDFFDEDTNTELSITKEDGSVDTDLQATIFDVVRKIPDFYSKILIAYTGISGKNSTSGATQ
jgi:hypothetical protein